MSESVPALGNKVCPQCAEEVKAAALVCRYCGHRFEPTIPPVARPSYPDVPRVHRHYSAEEGPDRREADKEKIIAAGYVVESERHDGQGALDVFYVAGPNWDSAQTAAAPARQTASRQAPPGTPATQQAGTPEAKAGDGTKQSLIGLVMLGGIVLGGAGLFQSDGINWLMVAGGVLVVVFGLYLMGQAFPGGVPDTSPERAELLKATGKWTRPIVIRTYKNDDSGLRKANTEAHLLVQHGYSPAGQSATGGHVNLGRTATGAVLTGGISLLFGGSRSKGTIQITFTR